LHPFSYVIRICHAVSAEASFVYPFVRSGGARAIEVRVRDVPEDSTRAECGWIVFDSDGRVLDFVTP
jgi:hypothetical protein